MFYTSRRPRRPILSPTALRLLLVGVLVWAGVLTAGVLAGTGALGVGGTRTGAVALLLVVPVVKVIRRTGYAR